MVGQPYLYVKNQRLTIDWSWWWEVCFEKVEVEKYISLQLLLDFKMEDTYIFCNVIEIFDGKKWPK